MPTISFVKKINPINVEQGADLMQSLLKAGLPVASSCLGDGVCGKCRLVIVSGLENLSPIGPIERIAHDRLRIPRGVRLSCQARVNGDVVVDASYW